MVQNNISNVDYIYTLDYMRFRGGLIGLHGYSHSDDKKNTGDGSDFGLNQNNSRKLSDQQIWKARNTADFLKIPYSFFEFPHYEATPIQMEVAEEHFKYIYGPYSEKDLNHIIRLPNGTTYVPTPLNYLDGEDKLESFLDKAKSNMDTKILQSFFFHPDIEFSYIIISNKINSYPSIQYNTNSPLHQLLSFYEKNNVSFAYITD